MGTVAAPLLLTVSTACVTCGLSAVHAELRAGAALHSCLDARLVYVGGCLKVPSNINMMCSLVKGGSTTPEPIKHLSFKIEQSLGQIKQVNNIGSYK